MIRLRTRLTQTVLLAAGAALLGACGNDPGPTTEAVTSRTPQTTGAVSLEIPVSTPRTLDIPLRPPPTLERVEVEIRPEEPCTLEARIENDTLGFEKDSHHISDDGKALIRKFVQLLLDANPGSTPARIELLGYASSEGDESYNLTLSRNRAHAGRELLASIPELAGVPIAAEGRGEADPIGDNSTEEGRRMNRRVEIYFQFPGCP